MKDTTLCYIERNHQYLMLHRTKKENDLNHDKWIGIGGHVEAGETPTDCILREAREETGLQLLDLTYRGLIHFRSDLWEDEEMYLFTATRFTGELIACDEGELEWVDIDEIENLPLWEGDKIFLKLLREGASGFELTLYYRGEELINSVLGEGK